MPVVTMPDGVPVSFPDDMPAEHIKALIANKFPDQVKLTLGNDPSIVPPGTTGTPDVGRGNAIATNALQGFTGNLGDELAGLTAAGGGSPAGGITAGGAPTLSAGVARLLYEKLTNRPTLSSTITGDQPNGPATQAYEEAAGKINEQQKAAHEQYPITSIASEIGGAIASPMTRAIPLAQGANWTARALNSAKNAGIYGTVSGAGSGETLPERAQNAAIGGVVSTGAGAVASPVADVIGKGISAAGRVVSSPFSNLAALRNPDRVAANTIAGGIRQAEATGDKTALTRAEFDKAQAEGLPVSVMDLAGDAGRNMARRVRNEPGAFEGRQAVSDVTNERYLGQGQRLANDVERLTVGNHRIDTDELRAANSAVNNINYKAAHAQSDEAVKTAIEGSGKAPAGTIRLYRGETQGGSPAHPGSGMTGGWFTTDLEKAKTYGAVKYIDIPRNDKKTLMNFVQGHGGPDEFVTDNKSIINSAKAFIEGGATRPLLTDRFKQLLQSPIAQRALAPAAEREANRTIVEGAQRARKFPLVVEKTEAGNVKIGLRQSQSGDSQSVFDLHAMDAVARALRDFAGSAERSGNRELSRDVTILRKAWLEEADKLVPAYAKARGEAFKRFKAEDAFEAGQNFVKRVGKMGDREFSLAQKEVNSWSPSERELFKRGGGQELAQWLRSIPENQDVVPKILNSDAARQQMTMLFGAPAVRRLEASKRVEQIMEFGHKAVSGNSTTAFQLALERGGNSALAGAGLGGGYALLSGDNPLTSGAIASGLLAGNKRLSLAVNAKVLDSLGKMLASGNRHQYEAAINSIVKNEKLFNAIRQISLGIEKGGAGATGAETAPAISQRVPLMIGGPRAENEPEARPPLGR